jgi:hypothetical protein
MTMKFSSALQLVKEADVFNSLCKHLRNIIELLVLF